MTRICFLPIAGPQDPGQMLTMRALAASGQFEVKHGCAGKLFPGIRTWFKYRPDYLHFDWIDGYFVGRTPLYTLIKSLSLWIDLCFLGWFCPCTLVWTLHNLRSHERGCPEWIERGMQRLMARRARWIRVFSQSSVKRAAERLNVPAAKFRVLPEASFVGYYPNTIMAAEARARLQLDAGDFVLLWLGSLRPYKGVEELIACFTRMAPPHWRLLIAGRPHIRDYAESVAKLAEKNPQVKIFARFIEVEELQVFYNASDAVVLPFVEVENSGSLLVAMGFARAIVAPALGIIPERLCRQPELLYLPGRLEESLRRLAGLDQAHLRALGRQNLEEVTKYQWDDLAKFFPQSA
jgi:glycosyltransferase involved in cell wall biosynthesis